MIAAATAQQEVAPFESRVHAVDGSEKIVLISARTIPSEGINGLLVAYLDVTAERQREVAIQSLNTSLESRVECRTHELSESNKKLEFALESVKRAQGELIRAEKQAALGSLVAGVAHELNTPIGNSLTVATTLFDNTRDFTRLFDSGAVRKSELAEFLSSANQAAALLARSMERAHDLVSNFKQVAVDQASENRRLFDLATVVREIMEVLRPSVKNLPWRIELELPEQVAINGFPGPLGQVITNLVSNAKMHAFSGRSSGLLKFSGTADAKQVTLMCEDDGCGMDENTLARIYDPFFTTKFGRGGSGLGMSIVFNIVTALLGGTIHVASALGQGTRFTIVIPREAPPALSEPSTRLV